MIHLYAKALEHRLEAFKDQARIHGAKFEGDGEGGDASASQNVMKLPSMAEWDAMDEAEKAKKSETVANFLKNNFGVRM